MLSDKEVLEMARKHASAYTNRYTPGETSYGFMDKALLAFARELLAAAGVDAPQSENCNCIGFCKGNSAHGVGVPHGR